MTAEVAAATRSVAIGPTWRRNEQGRFVLPRRTIGWSAIGWIEDYLLQPDGPDAGDPFRLTDEQMRFLVWWYAIDARGRFVYRGGMLRRMKGWGKDPFAAAICCVEFLGPCRFGGWDADGEAVAVPHQASNVQIAAVSQDQVKRNTMSLFPQMLSERAIDEYDGEVVYGPEIISRGFVYVREQEDLIKRAQEAVSKVIKKKTPVSVLENKIKDALGNFAAREIGRRPMILPLVIEV